MKKKYYLAIDLKNTSGSFTLSEFSPTCLNLTSLGEFPIEPVRQNGRLCWDMESIFKEIKAGITRATMACGSQLVSVGITSWGTDFGLLDENGKLVQNPLCYYEQQQSEICSSFKKLVPAETLYRMIGVIPGNLSSLYELIALKKAQPEVIEAAKMYLPIPCILNYWLTGIAAADRTIASNHDMYLANAPTWEKTLITSMGLPPDIFPPIRIPGTVLGPIQDSLKEELRLQGDVKVILPGALDSACALSSIPSEGGNTAFAYAGTWSTIGSVVRKPLLTTQAMKSGFKNNSSSSGGINMVRCTPCIGLLDECRKMWGKEDGAAIPSEELSEMAFNGKPFSAVIDIRDSIFLESNNIPSAVLDYCRKTQQAEPESREDIVRLLMEGIALWYRQVITSLEELSGERIYCLHIAGGGAYMHMLNRLVANALNRRVLAGPKLAKSFGNVMMQMIAMGDVSSLVEGKDIVRKSFLEIVFDPVGEDGWDQALGKLEMLQASNS
ncbi:MAG: FGGY family carbohydrate kinase [Kiritimatiellaceae bacterium]|nr:FGGY family carbohydrate kinase [Kiritimatiellaceae bacterium]